MGKKTSLEWSDDFDGSGRTYILHINRADYGLAVLDNFDRALLDDIENGKPSDTPLADMLLGLETLVRKIELAQPTQDKPNEAEGISDE